MCIRDRAYVVRAIMTYIPVILVCLEGKPHIGARFTVLFILSLIHIFKQSAITGFQIIGGAFLGLFGAAYLYR